MKTVSVFAIFLFAITTSVLGQNGATNKIDKQSDNSFYNKALQVRDALLFPDRKNGPSKIVDHLDNPSGTVVLDGKMPAEKAQESIRNYQQVVFNADYAEIPVQRGNSIYRIPVFKESPHYTLDKPDILSQLESYIQTCQTETGEVPYSILFRHSDEFNRCAFFSYLSISQRFQRPFHAGRLNDGYIWKPVDHETDLLCAAKE